MSEVSEMVNGNSPAHNQRRADNQARARQLSGFLDDEDLFAMRLQTLTGAQFEVLSLAARGYLNKQIADICGITEATVKAHSAEAVRRLDVRPRTKALIKLAVYADRAQRI